MRAKLAILVLCLTIASQAPAATIVWVELPGASAATVRRLIDEGLLPWLAAVEERGDLRSVDAAFAAGIDSSRAALRRDSRGRVVDIGWSGRPAAGEMVLAISSDLRTAGAWENEDGSPSTEMRMAWQGEADMADFRHIAGLDETLRWEEVLEFASLTERQTRALAAMPTAPEHPLWRMRRAFAVDRLYGNAAIYYGRDRRPDRLFLRLGLADAYENDLLPWTATALAEADSAYVPALEAEQSARLFFLRRLRSSSPRLYGRLDRILQSIQVELRGDSFIVVDATDSNDPFIALAGGSRSQRERIAPATP